MNFFMTTGDMPPGKMDERVDFHLQLPGYEGCSTIVITYHIKGGRQTVRLFV